MGSSIVLGVVVALVFFCVWVVLVKKAIDRDEKLKSILLGTDSLCFYILLGIINVCFACLNTYFIFLIPQITWLHVLAEVLITVLMPLVFVRITGRFIRQGAIFYNEIAGDKRILFSAGDEYISFIMIYLCEALVAVFGTDLIGINHAMFAAAGGAVLMNFMPVRWMLLGLEGEKGTIEGIKLLIKSRKNNTTKNVVKVLVLTEVIFIYCILMSKTRVIYSISVGAGFGSFVFLLIYYYNGLYIIFKCFDKIREIREEIKMKKRLELIKESIQNKRKLKDKKIDVKEKIKRDHIYFARHGECEANTKKLICGKTNSPLTSKGISQAQALADKIKKENLKIDLIISSPLDRAKTTAEIVAKTINAPIKIDERLREQNFGVWENKLVTSEEFLLIKKNPAESFEGGESLLKVSQRIYNFLDDVENIEGEVLVIAHNAAARIMTSYFEILDEKQFYNYYIDNATLKKFNYRNLKQPSIEKASDVVVRDAYEEIKKLAAFIEEKGENNGE